MKRLRLAQSELDEKSIKEMPLYVSATLEIIAADEGKKLYLLASETTQLLREKVTPLQKVQWFRATVLEIEDGERIHPHPGPRGL